MRRPSVRALLGTLFGSAPGFLLPFLVASHFGVGRITDAYVYALSIATFGLTLSVSVLEPNALPLAQGALEQGSGALRGFAVKTSARAASAVAVLALPIAAVGAFLVANRGSWTSSEKHLAITLILIFLVLLAATGASSVLASCLYALDSFLLPTFTQGLRSIIPLIALTMISTGKVGAEYLALAVICGELLRITLLSIRVWTLSSSRTASEPSRRLLISLWRAAVPAALGVFVVAANPLIDRTVAARLGPGSVTILDLGEKLFYVPVTIIQSSLVLVAGARWARLGADRPSALRGDFNRSVRRTVLLATALAVATAAALALAPVLFPVRIGGISVQRITVVCLCFVIGIPGAGLWMLCGRMLVIAQRTRILPLVAIGALCLNIGGDLIGAEVLGVRGIALASALVTTVNGSVGLLVCRVLLQPTSALPYWLRWTVGAQQ